MDNRVISYRMASMGTFYEGTVMRVVTRDLAGSIVTLSETTTGLTYDEFTRAYPTIPVQGRSASDLSTDISRLSDDDLKKLGLTRAEGVVQQQVPDPENVDLTPKFEYPNAQGYGWYLLSNGEKVKGKTNAIEAQKEVDSGERV